MNKRTHVNCFGLAKILTRQGPNNNGSIGYDLMFPMELAVQDFGEAHLIIVCPSKVDLVFLLYTGLSIVCFHGSYNSHRTILATFLCTGTKTIMVEILTN